MYCLSVEVAIGWHCNHGQLVQQLHCNCQVARSKQLQPTRLVRGMMDERIGVWLVQRSRSTGLRYYMNPLTRESVWHDPALPFGWGWMKVSPDAPRTYVDLVRGTRQSTMPTEASGIPESDVGAPSAKRARVEAAPAAAASEVTAVVTRPAAAAAATHVVLAESAPAPASSTIAASPSAQRPPSVIEANPGAVEGVPCAVFPNLRSSDFSTGRCDERPANPVAIDNTFFREPHRLLVRQLVASIMATTRGRQLQELQQHRREVERAALRGEEPRHVEALDHSIVCVDIGAGLGGATAYLLEQLRARAAASAASVPAVSAPSVSIYAVDLWELGNTYYADSLREFGNPSALCAAPAARATHEQFCANFWADDDAVFPARYPDDAFVARLSSLGIVPALVYIDS